MASGHALSFGKRSLDGSGKAMLARTGRTMDVVRGVLFEIGLDDMLRLDAYEGVGNGYRREERLVVALAGTDGEAVEQVAAAAYLPEASHIDHRLVPYDWYWALALAGAHQHRLPKEWIARLEGFPRRDDPTPERKQRVEALKHLKDAGFAHLLSMSAGPEAR
jgi:hypothetical protein